MREKGAQWLVTLGLVHHWARRQVSPTSLAFGESSSCRFLAIFTHLVCFQFALCGLEKMAFCDKKTTTAKTLKNQAVRAGELDDSPNARLVGGNLSPRPVVHESQSY